ncbi:MAG: hypothetical protein JXR91_03565 [Deltaproteobacteria bacterium]|nr:hypothetical protein [Deltaproteobacteria bacterium]
MTARTDAYEAKLETIKAIKKEDVKTPNMPMDTFISEASGLYNRAKNDFPKLKEVGVTEEAIEDLNIRNEAAAQAQGYWNNILRAQEDAQKEWLEESPAAFALRDEIIRAMRLGYRKNKNLLSRVALVAEGDTNADMIQDLTDVTIIANENPEPLKAINFDMSKIEKAAALSSEMNTLRGKTDANSDLNKEVKLIRDKAYTHLKEAVDEIREFGQYVFWDDDSRRQAYTSAYNRKNNNSAKESTSDQTAAN